jgi:hypothetical protein
MKTLKLATALACLCCVAVPHVSLAKSGKKSQVQGTVQSDPNAIPLPSNLTSNDDFIDSGDEVPAGSTDRYAQQQTYGNQDPLRFTEVGSVLDSF